MKRFTGQTVLVTGAAGGIGRAIVEQFLAEGARVAVADRDTTGLNADLSLPGDLTEKHYTENLCAAVVEAFGQIDILVNNAGVITRGSVTDTSDDELHVSLGVNVEAPFRLCRSVIPLMSQQGGGVIVNTASCWGIRPGPNHAVYCMTKAALASLTQCMGRDHAHQNIRINAVCPNEVDTPMLRTGFAVRGLNAETAIAELDSTVPLGRIAQPDDIADVVCFLASNESRYLCGSLIEVNGGKPVG